MLPFLNAVADEIILLALSYLLISDIWKHNFLNIENFTLQFLCSCNRFLCTLRGLGWFLTDWHVYRAWSPNSVQATPEWLYVSNFSILEAQATRVLM